MRGVLYACLPCLGSSGLGNEGKKPGDDQIDHKFPKSQERQSSVPERKPVYSEGAHPPKQKRQPSLSKYTFPRSKEDSL